MRSIGRNLPAYLQEVNLALQIPLIYRVNWAMHFVGVLLQVYLLRMVWTAVYADRGSVDGIELSRLIAYLTLANLQWNLLWPFLGDLLQERIREGQVALDLTRPVGLIGQMLAQQVGMTAGTALFLVLAVLPALALGALLPPASALAGLLYVLSLVLAYGIVVLIGLLIGFVGFWTVETRGFMGIYFMVNQFLAGTLVPLWFFPPVLRTIADLLPFQNQAFVPVAIYLGQLTGAELVRALALQAFWVVALAALSRAVWRLALRRVVIQGG